jgi:hypothetical protein
MRKSARPQSRFTGFRQNLCVEVGPNPESSNPDQFIEHRFRQIDRASSFRGRYDTEQAGDGQARRIGSPTPPPFIHQREVSSKLDCRHDCFGLAKVQVLAEFLYALAVIRRCRYQPGLCSKVDRGWQVILGTYSFLIHGGRNENLVIKRRQDIKPSYARQIQYRRRVGGDDQIRSVWRRA